MSFLSLDLETAGLNPEKHSILEIGAILDDGRPLEELPTFHYQILNETIVGQPKALEMAANNGLLDSDLPKLKPKHAGVALAGWLYEEGGRETPLDREYITFAGKNAASFDIPFLKKQIPHFEELFTVRSRVLDPTTLYYRPQEDRPPTLQECLDRAGIDEPVDHTALSDAKQVVKLIRNANDQT